MNSTSVFKPSVTEKQKFMARTYMWMGFALILSSLAAFFTAGYVSQLFESQQVQAANTLFMIIKVCGIAELVLVFVLSLSLKKISYAGAAFMFIVYSMINGITLSSIFFLFDVTSIAFCFGGAAIMFIFMSIYGMVTKQSLAKAGHYLMMAVVGIIIVSLINFLMRSSTLDWLISIVTVVVFTGLTAYDSQKILITSQRANSSEAYKKISIIGALELYLDFINIFLSLLRLFGRKK